MGRGCKPMCLPIDRVKVNAVQLPGPRFSIVSWSSRIDCPTSEVIVQCGCRSVDSRYRQLVDRMFEEIAAKVPGFEVPKGHQEGILISSPRAEVYYQPTCPRRAWSRSPDASVSMFTRTPRRSLRRISKTSRSSMSKSIFPTRPGTTIMPRYWISDPARC
jgi:hypothetical protein